MTRLLLVEDHVLVRQSIRAFLQETDFAVVGEASTGGEAVRLTRELKPDLVLMDIHLPEINGIEAARQIRREHPDVRIVVLTAYNEKAYQRAFTNIGVHDFVLKTAEFSELLRSIRRAMSNPLKTQSASVPVLGNVEYRLTEREAEVLRGAAQGLTNKQIGVRLEISARTVQVHLYTIYQKLNVANRTEAVLRAIALNMLPPTDGVVE